MAATNQPMIQLKDVSKIYDNGTVGLKDINLNIDKGEFVVVVGLSGAGKSTLLRSINRLQDVSKGDILIDGKSITSAKGKDLREIRRDIGMIFQSFNLVKRSSVLRNVLTGRVAYYPTWKTTFLLKKISKKHMKHCNVLIWQIRFILAQTNFLVDNNNVLLLLVYLLKILKLFQPMNQQLLQILKLHVELCMT